MDSTEHEGMSPSDGEGPGHEPETDDDAAAVGASDGAPTTTMDAPTTDSPITDSPTGEFGPVSTGPTEVTPTDVTPAAAALVAVAPPADSDGLDGPTPGTTSTEATEVHRRPRSRWKRRALWVMAIPLALLVLLVAAWAVDNAMTGDDVARNTELAGTPVGGMDEAELDAAVDELAAELPSTEVVIETGDLTLTTTAGELGLGIDTAATTDAVMTTGDDVSLLMRPFRWLGSVFTPRAADVVVSVDEATADATLAALEGEDRLAPVEPSFVIVEGAAQLSGGVDGVELTVADVLGALPTSLGDVTEPIVVSTERTVVPPVTGDEAVQPLVDQANSIRERTITVSAGDQSFELEGQALVDGFSVQESDGTARLTVSEEVIGQQIAARDGLNSNPTGVTFTAGGAGLVPQAGQDVEICCGEGATEAIVDAFLAGQSEVAVPTRTMSAAQGVEWATTLGVNQVVSEFTTNHPCCQGRVGNIHAISDQLRGTLIAPGDTFSVNDTTGRRTREKGYVAAPAIVDGKHVQDVGGGVSQYATTMFNAAFFAGLPIPTYKMHSEYISRYPYAREATLFYPSVDLKVTNDTPYGIVIWPTYTDTSVTVQLWSTPWARGEETGKSKASGCGTVTTERTTTYPDGNQDTDTFRANYRCI